MPQFNILTLLIFFLLSACGQAPADAVDHVLWENPVSQSGLAPGSQGHGKTRVPGSWIVAFRAPASREALEFANFRTEVRLHQMLLTASFASDPRVKSVDFITSADLSSAAVGEELRGLQGLLRPGFGASKAPVGLRLGTGMESAPSAVAALAKVDFLSDEVATETLLEWEAAGRLWFADPNGISQLSDLTTTDDSFSTWSAAYTDLEASVAHLSAIKISSAFAAFSSRASDAVPSMADILANPPLIAVIDSGVDYLHPQLKNRIFQNPSPGATGCTNDIYGCNVTAMGNGTLGDGDVFPNGTTAAGQACPPEAEGCGHGTHVAGIIAAEYKTDGTKPSGPAGVCPFCKILVIKATSGEGGISDAAQLAGLKYVSLFRSNSSNAIRVVNASFGQFQRSRAIAVIVSGLRRTSNGIVVVAAAGNEDTMLRSYPAALTDVIAVSAVTDEKEKANFSNFGNWVDIAAPGVAISSTLPGGSTGKKSGTSMATPVVAGTIGLLVAFSPSLAAADIHARMIGTADPSIYEAATNPLNYQYYYARIAGETIPRPLLGSGLVQASSVFKSNATGAYTPEAIQRVTPGCGLISHQRSNDSADFDLGFGFIFLIPFLLVFVKKFRGRPFATDSVEADSWA